MCIQESTIYLKIENVHYLGNFIYFILLIYIMLKKSKDGHNIDENRNNLIAVKEKQNVENTRGIDYELYKSSLPTSNKIKAPEYNVSITKDLYGKKPDIDYNIPGNNGSIGKIKQAAHKKPKYNPKFDLRVGNDIIMGGVNVNAIAKYCFTDVRTQRYFIECIDANDDYESCLIKGIKFEQDLIKKRDEAQREHFLIFDENDLAYLKLQGINPNEGVKFDVIKTHDLIDENGNFRSENFKKLLLHIHGENNNIEY